MDLSPWVLGLSNGMNPCALATVLCLLILLNWRARTFKEVIIISAVYSITVAGIHVLLVFGGFDFLLEKPWYYPLVQKFYALFLFVFSLIGFVLLRDWWVYKKYLDVKQFLIPVPSFLENKGKLFKTKVGFFFDYFFAPIALGIIFALFSSALSRDYWLFVAIMNSAYEHAAKSAIWITVSKYALATIGPLIVVTLLILLLIKLNQKYSLAKIISYVKIVCSSLFLSTAIALGMFLLLG